MFRSEVSKTSGGATWIRRVHFNRLLCWRRKHVCQVRNGIMDQRIVDRPTDIFVNVAIWLVGRIEAGGQVATRDTVGKGALFGRFWIGCTLELCPRTVVIGASRYCYLAYNSVSRGVDSAPWTIRAEQTSVNVGHATDITT